MDDAGLQQRAAAVRRFSRCYTRRIGVLQEGLLGSPLSLTEARVVYELAQGRAASAAAIAEGLGLDPGYLSRILAGFEKRGLIERRPSPGDGRTQTIALTERGRETYATLDARSQAEIGALLATLRPEDQARLVACLTTAERLLDGGEAASYLLRPHRPGDIGWVVHRHGALYAEEYGLDASFEALVAEIAAAFLKNFDPRREYCWIAERDGAVVGSVFCIRDSDEVAKLRLLYVEPDARRLGIGRRLVEECIAFARRAGYRKLTLWTNDVLVSARRIYEAAGFRLVEEEPHRSFGQSLVGQHWELPLPPRRAAVVTAPED
jgi:DNA-binding MarR family transcriptional regulator/N-acetylglutamate synthase-like GNAT family acetyltransferase